MGGFFKEVQFYHNEAVVEHSNKLFCIIVLSEKNGGSGLDRHVAFKMLRLHVSKYLVDKDRL